MNRFSSRTSSELLTLLKVKEDQQEKGYSARRAVSIEKIAAELADRFGVPPTVHCEVCQKVYREADYDGPEDANEAFAQDHDGKLLPQGSLAPE